VIRLDSQEDVEAMRDQRYNVVGQNETKKGENKGTTF